MKEAKENKNIKWQTFKISQKDREALNKHKAFVVWFTGLSGSGKSSIANQLESVLFQNNYHTYIIDGDNTRKGINSDLEFSVEGRNENLRRMAEIAKLMQNAGLIVIVSAISPLETHREMARNLIEPGKFVEVFVDCPLEECEKRDVKGLYAMARKGQIKDFTGISSPFEIPKKPEIIVHSHKETVEESTQKILNYLQDKLLINEL